MLVGSARSDGTVVTTTVVGLRELLTTAAGSVEDSLDISKAFEVGFKELEDRAVNVVGHGCGGMMSVGSGLGVPGEMVRVKFRRVKVDVITMVDIKGLTVTAPVQGNVIVWVELFVGGTVRRNCDELDLALEVELLIWL